MEVVIASEVQARSQADMTGAISLRPGATIMQRVFNIDARDGLNFGLNRIQFLPGDQAFRSSRHHHGFQQIRFAEKGSINYGPDQFIHEGDIAYFPRGAFYGPQLKDQGVGMTIQLGFGGEKQSGKVWEQYRDEAMRELAARGDLKDDILIVVDPVTGEKKEVEAVDAIFAAQYERHTNQKWVVAAEGYDAPILMHPPAFEYYQAAPGVEIKHLGRFYDHAGPNADTRISMVRLSGGGEYRLGADRAQAAWTTAAGLEVDGRAYGALPCAYCPRDETALLSSRESIEVYIVEFPRLD